MIFTPRKTSLGPNFLRCLFAAIWLSAVCSFGADVWVTQAGGGDGSSTNSPLSQNQINALSGTITDTTYHLCNTFTNGFDAPANFGTPGHPVTFLFEPNGKLSAPAWGQWQGPLDVNHANSFSNGSPFRLDSPGNVIIDGGTNGLIEATANASGWLQWSNRCDGLVLNLLGGSFEIKNLTISNLYQRYNGQDDAYTTGHGGDPFYIVGGNGIVIAGGFTNSSIHNCHLLGTGNIIAVSYTGNTDNNQIYSNTISHCSFGIQVYGYYQAQGSAWQLWANNINIGNDWSGNNSFFHGDAIILNQHQGNYTLLNQQSVATGGTILQAAYAANGLSTNAIPGQSGNVSPAEVGDYYSIYSWTNNGSANNISVEVGPYPGAGSSITYSVSTNFYVPSGCGVFFHGNPGATNTAIVTWTPTTNCSFQISQPAKNFFYDSNGNYVVNLPQWGNYGSYYNWSQNGDTNNISCVFSNSIINAASPNFSFFPQTNFLVLTGTTNAPVTALVTWLHAATNINCKIYRNFIGPTWGTNASAIIGVYADMPSGVQNYKIANNVFVIDNVTTNSLMGNSIGAANNSVIANNTFVQLNRIPIGVGTTAGYGGGTVLNNIFYNFNNAASFNTINTDQRGWGWFTNINFNTYYGISEWLSGWGAWPNLFYAPSGNPPFFGAGIAVYQQPQYEKFSTNGAIEISFQNYGLITNSTSLSTATNLIAYFTQIGFPEGTNDFYGVPWPAVANWNPGAIATATIDTNAPKILINALPIIVLSNTPASITAVATGEWPLQWKWFWTNGTPIASISGINFNTFTTNGAPAFTNYAVAVVTNLFGSSATSAPVMVALTNATGPAFVSQPQSVTGQTNTTLTLSVTYTGTDIAPNYVDLYWYYTNLVQTTPVSVALNAGVATSSLAITSAVPSTNWYFCIASNLLNLTATSSVAKVVFTAFPNTNVLASFTGTPLVGLAALPVSFTDTSQNPTNWAWTFGDGGTSTAQNPSHTYSLSGTYSVALTIIGLGQTNEVTQNNYITATNAPNNPLYPLSVDGSVTYHASNDVVTVTCTNAGSFYKWLYFSGSLIGSGCMQNYIMPAQSSFLISLYTNQPPASILFPPWHIYGP